MCVGVWVVFALLVVWLVSPAGSAPRIDGKRTSCRQEMTLEHKGREALWCMHLCCCAFIFTKHIFGKDIVCVTL